MITTTLPQNIFAIVVIQKKNKRYWSNIEIQSNKKKTKIKNRHFKFNKKKQ